MILNGDVLEMLKTLPDESVQCCVTSPPYWGLRDYGMPGQIGLEKTPEKYVAKMVEVFREVRRVLRSDGVLWLNLGDSYFGSWGNYGGQNRGNGSQREITNGSAVQNPAYDGLETYRPPTEYAHDSLKAKDLVGIPWSTAIALRLDGWYLRSAIVWAKPNGMPGSQDDRPTSSYEMVFLLSVSPRYFSDFDAIKTPPRESTLMRLAQDVQAQAGSHRANGGAKTNGTMKAVQKKDKQRGHSRKHAGFNERWDAMPKTEQQSTPAMIRDVWFIPPSGYDGAHFAVMPEELARRCILAGSRPGDTILDPFAGSGTTLEVAERMGRKSIGIELNPKYVTELIEPRLANVNPLFTEGKAI